MSYHISINNPNEQGQVIPVYGPTRSLQELLDLIPTPTFLSSKVEYNITKTTPIFITRAEQNPRTKRTKINILWRWHSTRKTWVRKVWEIQ